LDEEGKPSIAICGVGGAGCNTINRLIRMGTAKADLIAFNTDKKHLNLVDSKARRCLLGQSITRGLGAGGSPEIAEKAAWASRRAISQHLSGQDIVFLACGMGGGTGTGASPVIAQIAKEKGALVVAFCTYPFSIEKARLSVAKEGIAKLQKHADTLVLIDNNRLVSYAGNLPIEKAFEALDEIIAKAIRGISKTIMEPSLLNLDFMDLRAVLEGGGISTIAVGDASGYDRVEKLAESVFKHRLLDSNISGAKGVLLHITGGSDLTLGEATRAGELLTQGVDPDANVIYGARIEEGFEKRIEAIAIFTGIGKDYRLGKR
jgi:cell division protein FtsZ